MNTSPFVFIPPWLNEFRSVAVALLSNEGNLIQANQGFLAVIPDLGDSKNISTFFINPKFPELLASTEATDAPIYEGLITIGSRVGLHRSFSGRIFRMQQMFFLAAELDFAVFEKLSSEAEQRAKEVSDLKRQILKRSQALQKSQEEIRGLKQLDPVTGLYNRKQLDIHIDEEMKRWERYRRPLALVLMDLDHFSAINDEYGRDVGDDVIRHVGTILKQLVRALDMAVRYGGQEFGLLLPETNEMGAVIVTERIRMELEGQLILPLLKPITASFGVAVLLPEERKEELMARAWRGVKHSKANGKNRITVAGVIAECDHLYGSVPKGEVDV